MRTQLFRAAVFVTLVAPAAIAQAQTALPGPREFGLTERELVQSVEKVEALIAECMREQGFEYIATDYRTVRRGMESMMSLPGMSEEQFIKEHGFGISTLYTGEAPQLAKGYSPSKVGLGEKNVQIFNKLAPANQVAYNRALLGDNTDATFAVSLDIENFSRCGGCTLKAIEQVFKPEQLKGTYTNPRDALIRNDPRMKAALRKYADEMRKSGFDYTDPEAVEAHIRDRLYAITENGTIPLKQMSPEKMAALKKLQADERRIAPLNFELEERIVEPVVKRIERELFARAVN
ncbi:MAG TPA: hypothetical protein VG758_09885 [Hyphomicrobiaceae bacterium]|jgi:hypothetical protein|nr:hypothetical protein [Hyphomicrobiaceae bacterium]